MISRLAISGYRSLRDIRLDLGRLTVITGANGSGKSSLYRALRLLADVAQGRVIQSLAAEGGLPSTLWAGPETITKAMRSGVHELQGTRRKNPVSLRLGFSDDDYGYAIDLGLPTLGESHYFYRDPRIKLESLWLGPALTPRSAFAERQNQMVKIRGKGGDWRLILSDLQSFDSMLTHAADPREAAELLILRDRLRNWRFYDQLRTDRDSPVRRPQVGTYTPVLASDGADLAAAIATILEIGEREALHEAVADAFPGGSLLIAESDGFLEVQMQQHGLLRPLRTAELSDGTLRYVLLMAALLSPRPPELMILNEPEASLHPDLLLPLARLITRASAQSQIIVVSHAPALVEALAEEGCLQITLAKNLGETVIEGQEYPPAWTWPNR